MIYFSTKAILQNLTIFNIFIKSIEFSFLTISSHSKWTAIIAAIMSNRQIRSSFHGFWLNNLNCVCANLKLSDTQFVLISAHCYSYNWNCFGKMLLSAILYPNRVCHRNGCRNLFWRKSNEFLHWWNWDCTLWFWILHQHEASLWSVSYWSQIIKLIQETGLICTQIFGI